MINKIKTLRISADEASKLCLSIATEKSVLLTRASTEILLGKAWLGKLLGNYNVDSPYSKDGSRKTVEDIEPTAESSIPQDWDKSFNYIQRVDQLRQYLSMLSEDIKNLELGRGTWEANVARTNAFVHICQARFNLGFELERLREEDIKKTTTQNILPKKK